MQSCKFSRRIVVYARACAFLFGALLFSESAFSQEMVVVALGDSNTAGVGVGAGGAFPALLDARLQQMRRSVRVINAGVPGDTLRGMLGRLGSSIPPGTRVVIVQGGYNDLAVGNSPETIVASIRGILAELRAQRVKAVLCGFFYPNWDAVGRSLAASYGATFVQGSACYDPTHRGPDGLHMNAAGHQVVASRLAPVVEKVLYQRCASPACARASARACGTCRQARHRQ